MKLICGILSVSVLGSSILWKPDSTITLIVTGNAMGQLSPCGCTKPMSGGIKRMVTKIKELRNSGPSIWVDLGSNIAGKTDQDQLKFETYLQIAASAKVDFIDLETDVRTLGRSGAISAENLIGPNRNINTLPQTKLGIRFRKTGDGVEVSSSNGKKILALKQTEGTGFSKSGELSPGSKLRSIGIVRMRNGRLLSSAIIPLEPSIKDDTKASNAYDLYQTRVKLDDLASRNPRGETEGFVGSEKCGSCHSEALKTHRNSAHARALKTLISDRHEYDPECLSCHVVGLNSTKGYFPHKNSQLGEVGCESCHGPGVVHSDKPTIKMGPVGEKSCLSCHTTSTSPKFSFLTYWRKIQHR